MITLKTEEEMKLMYEANQLVGKTLAEVAKHIAPGVSTLSLDKIAHDFIMDNGAYPAFLGYSGFPNSSPLTKRLYTASQELISSFKKGILCPWIVVPS